MDTFYVHWQCTVTNASNFIENFFMKSLSITFHNIKHFWVLEDYKNYEKIPKTEPS